MSTDIILKLAEQYEKLSKTRGKTTDISFFDQIADKPKIKTIINGDLIVTGTIKVGK